MQWAALTRADAPGILAAVAARLLVGWLAEAFWSVACRALDRVLPAAPPGSRSASVRLGLLVTVGGLATLGALALVLDAVLPGD